MKRLFLMVLCALFVVPAIATPCEESDSLCCFNEHVISLNQFKNLDMLAVFELVYEMAELRGIVDELPEGFIHCLEVLRAGDDRVHCGDFMEALQLILETVLIMRADENLEVKCSTKSFESEVREFSNDVFEALCQIWDRLEALESNVGLEAF